MKPTSYLMRGAMITASACLLLAMLSGCPEPSEVTLEINPEETTLEVGEEATLTAVSNDLLTSYTWSSSDTSVATVQSASNQSATVTGVSPGTVEVTVTSENSGKQAGAKVTVVEASSEEPVEEVEQVRRVLESIPEDRIDEDTRKELGEKLDETEKALREEEVCNAATVLDEFLLRAQTFRAEFPSASLSDPTWAPDLLYAEGRTLQYEIINSLPEKEVCPGFERYREEAEVEGVEGDVNGLNARFSFGAPRMWSMQYEGTDRTYTQLHIPNTALESGEPGKPHIPSMRKLVAIPPDSDVVATPKPRIAEEFQVIASPIQEQPADQRASEEEPPPEETFANKPFVVDKELYTSDSPWPPEPVKLTPMGSYRGLELMQVEVFAGEFSPASNLLQLYEDVEVQIEFNSKSEGFVPSTLAENPFESQYEYIVNQTLNREIVLKTPPIEVTIRPNIFGEEYLILTHPDFRAAANDLAAWKNQKGIVTNVVEVGTNTGINDRETRDEIKAYIKSRHESNLIKPSYILLLGDAEFIAPFYRNGMYGSVGTDWPYAVLNDPGEDEPLVPTFAVGRIPVDTQDQAQVVVDKIVEYEKNPPGGFLSSFYDETTLAAQFQCCRTGVTQVGRAQRTFTEVSEFVRDALMSNGYNVERIYELTVDSSYTEDSTPRRYYDNTLIPADIGPSSTFAWDGSRQDILDAYDDGRFLMVHRDHGWHSGWVHPPFTNTNASNLDNAPFLPVVYSINCSSGLFDNETAPGAEGSSTSGTYLAERLLRNPTGGAVGMIGDTRVSPSWPNTALLRGLIDASWPDTVPDFGGDESLRRLGDILNHAKAYVATQVGISGQGTSQNAYESELILYHVLGDPTLEMWTENPHTLPVLKIPELLEILETKLVFKHESIGAEVTVSQEGKEELRPIGRGVVDEEGIVEIDFYAAEPVPDVPLLVSTTQENRVATTQELVIEQEPRK